MFKGFSLSELLLTLALIGIVATLTIPRLMQSTKEIEIKSGIKTGYTILASAYYSSIKEKGYSSGTGICNNDDHSCFKDFMNAKLNYAYDCSGDTSKCWSNHGYYDGTPAPTSGSAVILQNGMTVLFEWLSSSCTATNNDKCGRVSIDINGLRGPNQYGKDTFAFHAWQTSLIPYGIGLDTGNSKTCNETDTGAFSGFGCATEYLTK